MKKKQQLSNPFDSLVEKLIEEFSKIPNFDLTSTDDVGRNVFNLISFRLAEITSYRDLIIHSFIPATNKAIFEAKKAVQNSKYKVYLNQSDLDYDDTLYETV